MLERILLEADPVLTWGGDVLRVEGFSSCCGIYARLDVSGSILEGDTMRPGSTNVDFNQGMRGALAQIRDDDLFTLEVGSEGVAVGQDAGGVLATVKERKVRLPLRWIRGFAEVQAVQVRMEPRFELDRSGAIRFLRSIPRVGRSSDAAWVIPTGRTARIGSARREGAVRVAGLARLRTLESALPMLERLAVHEDPSTGASAWRLDGGSLSLSVVLSPETWRGFSGEGQLLSALTCQADVASVQSRLRWQSELRVEDLRDEGRSTADVEIALAWLASRGLVGFDLGRAAWFHRVLPFDLDTTRALLDRQYPRLKSARELFVEGAVTISDREDTVSATVRSDGVTHRVRIEPDHARCTCAWYAKHQGERGPCKHVLAVELALSQERRS